jgi:hypothetical protein
MPFDPRDLCPPDRLLQTQVLELKRERWRRVALSCCLTPGIGPWSLRTTRRRKRHARRSAKVPWRTM